LCPCALYPQCRRRDCCTIFDLLERFANKITKNQESPGSGKLGELGESFASLRETKPLLEVNLHLKNSSRKGAKLSPRLMNLWLRL
jgi:hypothetical protein